ncbi:hypothetical protein F0U59_23585 [Archangium gephyra]|nr:hypothetical protein F0U59_23585 [Archangium gephyra]
MQLRLKYPATPEAAPDHAQLCVSAVQNIEGITLDYSVESLAKLDEVIEGLRQDSVSAQEVAETLFSFGCYVGEVFVRHAKGQWRLAARTPMARAAGFPLVVQLGADTYCNPIGKVFKRLEEGLEHELTLFYRAFTT